MKTTKLVLKFFIFVTLVWYALNVQAQTAPTITTEPASQTNLPGTTAIFSVAVNGTGPFTYQWQFNGTNLPDNLITTVAGNGVASYSGDGGAATNASICYPHGIALDASGNLFIADTMNYRVRKVDTNGVITTVAGTNAAGYSGDGGAATNASLARPMDVALDASGNLYIADGLDNCIRMVNTNGIISTVAGTNAAGYSGDGGAATNASLYGPWGVIFDTTGNLYIADNGNGRIRKVDTNGIITTVVGGGSGWDGSAATNASLVNPAALAFDSAGNFYIAEDGTERIRKVDTNGIITTVAGSGPTNTAGSFSGDGGVATNATLSIPFGLVFDATGNLYIADELNNRIRMVNTNGIISTVAGNGNGVYSGDGGTATNASINWPFGVAVDSAGNLFIGDMQHQRIRKVNFPGYPTLALSNVNMTNIGNYSVVINGSYGSVTSSVASLTIAAPPVITVQPVSQIAALGGSLGFSVAAIGSGPFGYEWYLAGTNLVQTGTNSTFRLPNVSTNDGGNYTVIITNYWGSVTSQVAILMLELPPTVTIQPVSQTNQAGTTVSFNVAAGNAGPFTYQWQFNGTNLPNNIISTIAGGGSGGREPFPATNASLNQPWGITFDASGNLYFADNGFNRIRKVDTNGMFTTFAGGNDLSNIGDGGAATNATLTHPQGVTFNAFGNLFIADTMKNRVRKVDINGIITTVAGTNMSSLFFGDGGAATNAGLNQPSGVTFDAFGNLYIADMNHNRIRMVNTNGIITTVAGTNGLGKYAGDGGAATNASLNSPNGVVFDVAGNLYIADTGNRRIRMVNTNGIITTVAGTNGAGYSGDGGAATTASLYGPRGVIFDASGNLYIADTGNSRIRMVDTNGIITTVVGNGNAAFAGDGGAATNASLSHPTGVALDASGNLYIADNGNNRIREVYLAGHPVIVLANVSVTNAGNYSVVITSPYGSVTSAVVLLTVAIPNTPPQIMVSDGSFGFTTNQSGFGFNLTGIVSQTVVVDGSTNLVNWIPLFTNIVGSSPFYFFDPVWTNFPVRFYRARLQ